MESDPEQGRPEKITSDDRKVAQRLAQFNRRARQAFWSERRHGASEEQAFAAAERTLPR